VVETRHSACAFSRLDWRGHEPILVTGGASRNRGILRILADVFQARIVPLQVSNSSALGAALRAAQAVGGTSWEELARRFSAPANHLAMKPDPRTLAMYDEAGHQLERRLNEVLAIRL